MHNMVLSLERKERECLLIRHQLDDLRNSRSWKITVSRAFGGFCGVDLSWIEYSLLFR